ncbi:MAG: hypothetical protein NT055_00530 [Nitrospirae bacterium]|jgi:hypothetical protein|nr:hypothetical protein [Nitrospirota bacterium]
MARSEEAKCPFCGKMMDVPHKIRTRLGSDIVGGRCECEAVYVFDQSRHNLGEAYVDALNYACEGKCDNPWELIPGQDYQEITMYYDRRTHSFGKIRHGFENICFILLKKGDK